MQRGDRCGAMPFQGGSAGSNPVGDTAGNAPIGRYAQPNDTAGSAVFLLSPAAGFVPGIDLLVDRGFVIGDAVLALR